jgi:hypothetical protein
MVLKRGHLHGKTVAWRKAESGVEFKACVEMNQGAVKSRKSARSISEFRCRK